MPNPFSPVASSALTQTVHKHHRKFASRWVSSVCFIPPGHPGISTNTPVAASQMTGKLHGRPEWWEWRLQHVSSLWWWCFMQVSRVVNYSLGRSLSACCLEYNDSSLHSYQKCNNNFSTSYAVTTIPVCTMTKLGTWPAFSNMNMYIQIGVKKWSVRLALIHGHLPYQIWM